jgi:hypothetical protein
MKIGHSVCLLVILARGMAGALSSRGEKSALSDEARIAHLEERLRIPCH